MRDTIEIAILTKSLKNKNYCIAGIDVNSGKWIRLTSPDNETHGAITRNDLTYENGTCCEVFDVVSIQVLNHLANSLQPENVLIDRSHNWEKLRKVSLNEILQIHPTENHSNILGNIYNYITDKRIHSVGHSLELVRVSNFIISQTHNPAGHPQTKASFNYNGTLYEKMSVTDPDFLRKPDNTTYRDAVIVMSLPDAAWNDKYYKFVAQIFQYKN